LSAYSLALAERVFEEPSSTAYNTETIPALTKTLHRLGEGVSVQHRRQGFQEDKIRLDRMLNMRFEGMNTALMITAEDDTTFVARSKAAYKEQFGFVLDAPVVVGRCEGGWKNPPLRVQTTFAEVPRLQVKSVGKIRLCKIRPPEHA
jgi:5-oxoprolinase (ATP-hydrolysing)